MTVCLKCGKVFEPLYCFNRICAKCQKRNEKLREMPRVSVVIKIKALSE